MRKKVTMFISNLSYKKRRKRNLEYVKEKFKTYANMSNEEFLMEYINKISDYEYKKNISFVIYILLSFMFVTTVISYFYFIFYIDRVVPSSLINNAIIFYSLILTILIITISISFVKRNMVLKKIISEKTLIEQVSKIRQEKKYEQRK